MSKHLWNLSEAEPKAKLYELVVTQAKSCDDVPEVWYHYSTERGAFSRSERTRNLTRISAVKRSDKDLVEEPSDLDQMLSSMYSLTGSIIDVVRVLSLAETASCCNTDRPANNILMSLYETLQSDIADGELECNLDATEKTPLLLRELASEKFELYNPSYTEQDVKKQIILEIDDAIRWRLHRLIGHWNILLGRS